MGSAAGEKKEKGPSMGGLQTQDEVGRFTWKERQNRWNFAEGGFAVEEAENGRKKQEVWNGPRSVAAVGASSGTSRSKGAPFARRSIASR